MSQGHRFTQSTYLVETTLAFDGVLDILSSRLLADRGRANKTRQREIIAVRLFSQSFNPLAHLFVSLVVLLGCHGLLNPPPVSTDRH